MVNNILFYCHSLSDLFTPPREKAKKEAGELGDTAKATAREMFTQQTYGRREKQQNKYTKKGIRCEDAAITEVSLQKGVFLKKNSVRLTDDYITGEVDFFTGKDINAAESVHDIKNRWNVETFIEAINEPISKDYYIQLQGYMRLAGAPVAYLHDCLINSDYETIFEELKRESYDWPELSTPNWREIEILKNHIFDKKTFDEFIEARGCIPNDEDAQVIYDSFIEIPIQGRIFTREVPRDESIIQAIPEKVEKAREYIEKLIRP